jgi:hypothetical protein
MQCDLPVRERLFATTAERDATVETQSRKMAAAPSCYDAPTTEGGN